MMRGIRGDYALEIAIIGAIMRNIRGVIMCGQTRQFTSLSTRQKLIAIRNWWLGCHQQKSSINSPHPSKWIHCKDLV